jgi:CheY-like chemotaxis protein
MSAALSRNCARLGTFRVINLSADGALFRGARPIAARDVIDLGLSLTDGRHIDTSALVLREGELHRQTTFAVVFADPSPALRAALEAVVREALEDLRRAAVLVVDFSEQACRDCAERLQRLGLRSYGVTTALEALHTLDAAHHFQAALVNIHLGVDDGREVLVHLASQHPHIRRILMSPTLRREELLSLTESMTTGAPHALLPGACAGAELAAAMQPQR